MILSRFIDKFSVGAFFHLQRKSRTTGVGEAVVDVANFCNEPRLPNLYDAANVCYGRREKVFNNLMAFERCLWQVENSR